MAQTVLVTGGSGFVASWCIAELLDRGYDVRTTIRSAAKEPEIRAAASLEGDPGDRLAVTIADLVADDGWDVAMKDVAYVLHVAQPMGIGSDSSEDLVTPARDGALRILNAAAGAGVRRVVMTSAAMRRVHRTMPTRASATRLSGPIQLIRPSSPTAARRQSARKPHGTSCPLTAAP